MKHAMEMQGVLTVHTAREFQRQAEGGALYRELTGKLNLPQRPEPTKRQAVSQFVAASHAFASTVLQSPHDFPAHATDYALGLLSEALAYVQADQVATWKGQ